MRTYAALILSVLCAASLSAQDTKISDLPAGTPMGDADVFPIARAGANYKIPGSDLCRVADCTMTAPILAPTDCLTAVSYGFTGAGATAGLCRDSGGSIRVQSGTGASSSLIGADASGASFFFFNGSNQASGVQALNGTTDFYVGGAIHAALTAGLFKATAFAGNSGTPASVGLFRLANNTKICWRNAANSADLCTWYDASDVFNMDGTGTGSIWTFTNVAAPSTPAAGTTEIYVDSTSKNLAAKNDAGTINHGVQTASCTNQFLNAISDAGAATCASVAVTQLSSATSADLRGVLSDEVGSGVALFLDGSGNFDLGGTRTAFGSLAVISANTGAATTTAAQSAYVFTNTGDADGSSVTLLNDPTAGVNHSVVVTVAQTITVSPSTGETLYLNAASCANVTSSTIGSALSVVAVSGGSGAVWVASGAGWTCN